MDANWQGCLLLLCVGFNPRARDGRENIRRTWRNTFVVSIHAPVMDANFKWLYGKFVHLFQSTRP